MRTNFIAAVFGLTLAGMTSALPTEDSGLYSFLSRRATSPDNSCGIQLDGTNSGYVCDAAVSEGGCCSQYGFCGSSDDYCNAIGCQTAYGTCNAPSTTIPPAEDDFTCGPNNGGKTCSGTLCCSQNGFCGNTTDYCGAGCNSAYGKCSGNSNEAPGGTCGPNFGNTKCSDNQCCSQIGYCGITSDFCADPGSCLPGFGRCDSDTTPAGQSTANVARPKKGPVPYTEDIYDCVQNNVVALTYDDGPSAYTSQLLDLLKKYSFTATFFITGNNNGKGPIDTTSPYPDLIKRMVAEGHQVASHTWSHYSLTDSTSDVRKSQMVKNEMALNNIIGKWPTYMRPPYSQCSKESGCWADMEALGYHRVYFDLDTQDYLNPLPSQIQNSKLIVQTELADLTATDYLSIQHDIVQQSVTNLTSFYFDQIVKRGWKGVTAAECLGDTNKDNWYRSLSSSSSSTSAASSSTSRTSTTTATTTRASTTTATTTTRASTTTTSAATTSPTPSPPTCILKNGNWCGQIDPFTDAQSCRKAAADCGVETVKCYAANWFGFTTCIKWSPICAKLNTFCWTCSAKGNCNNKAFGY